MEHRPAESYQRRADEALEEMANLDRKSRWLAHGRLALFLIASGVALCAAMGWLPRSAWGGAALLLVAFVAAVVAHDRVFARARRARHLADINLRGLARLRGELASHPSTGLRYLDPSHRYAQDLDLFGASSLFQRLDTTGTAPGERMLANWLLEPAPVPQLHARQANVRRLAPLVDERQRLEIEGRMLGPEKNKAEPEKPDPGPLLRFCQSHVAIALSAPERWFARLSPSLVVLALFGWWLGVSPRSLVVLLALNALVLLIRRKEIARFLAPLTEVAERLRDLGPLFEALEALEPTLRDTGTPPSRELRRFAWLASWIRLREQPLFHIPLSVATLYDLHLCIQLGRWQERCRERIGSWFQTLAETEAAGSLAAFAFECPDHAFPQVEDGPAALEALDLGHPLIPPQRRICNDVSLGGEGRRALIVTGSNMAGKTTFLRTIGLAAVMAQAGGPVVARRLRMTPLTVATSMRVRDSLAEGVSLFHAEVRRLKQVVDLGLAGPTLFLLDEVLQGTNTAERTQASRAVLRGLVRHGAIGAVATHDLGMTEWEGEDWALNVHFTDHLVGDEMCFDYRLRPGIVRTTNALALIRKTGIVLES